MSRDFQHKKIFHFVLANWSSSSISGLVTNFANSLIERGHKVIVSYPLVDNWTYVIWSNQKKMKNDKSFLHQLVYALRIMKAFLFNFTTKECLFGFNGGLHSSLDKRVLRNHYFLLPSERNMPNADYLIISQEYLLPYVAKLNPKKGKVVSSVHIDYKHVLKDESLIGQFLQFMGSVSKKYVVPRFAVSKEAMKSAQAVGIKVDTVICNGINKNIFFDNKRRGQKNPLNITCLIQAGRFQKGAGWGVEVMSELRMRLKKDGIQGVCLKCFGSEISKLESLGNVNLIFDEIYGFLGHRDLVDLLQKTDIFVFPSFYEGFPSMILEAMACGCAVVSSRVAGMDHFCGSDPACLTAEPQNTLEMVHHILRLIEDAFLRDQLRSNAVKTTSSFTWDVLAEKLEQFLLSIR